MTLHVDDKYISRKDAAKILGITVATLKCYEQKKIPNWPAMYQLSPRIVRYSKKDTEQYLQSARM